MVLMARDPNWLYVYWDPTEEQQVRLWSSRAPMLRVMEMRAGNRAREIGRIALPQGANSWYLQVDAPGATYRAELGTVSPQGRFQVVLTSGPEATPRAEPSRDEEAVFAAFQPGRPPEPALAPPGSKQVHSERLYTLSSGQVDAGVDSAQAREALARISSLEHARPRRHA
jgi:hypothetical protein